MTLIFATNNAHKVTELRAALPPGMEVTTLAASGIHQDIPEPFHTLEENAREKARVIHELTGKNCFSEDTGLEVAALGGAPGVRSARFAGDTADAAGNMRKLMLEMEGSTERSARFRTVICLRLDEKEYLFEGICPGRITEAPSGTGGFGYDPVFIPDGATTTFAQMGLQEKNRYSHRRKAVDKLVAFLNNVGLKQD